MNKEMKRIRKVLMGFWALVNFCLWQGNVASAQENRIYQDNYWFRTWSGDIGSACFNLCRGIYFFGGGTVFVQEDNGQVLVSYSAGDQYKRVSAEAGKDEGKEVFTVNYLLGAMDVHQRITTTADRADIHVEMEATRPIKKANAYFSFALNETYRGLIRDSGCAYDSMGKSFSGKLTSPIFVPAPVKWFEFDDVSGAKVRYDFNQVCLSEINDSMKEGISNGTINFNVYPKGFERFQDLKAGDKGIIDFSVLLTPVPGGLKPRVYEFKEPASFNKFEWAVVGGNASVNDGHLVIQPGAILTSTEVFKNCDLEIRLKFDSAQPLTTGDAMVGYQNWPKYINWYWNKGPINTFSPYYREPDKENQAAERTKVEDFTQFHILKITWARNGVVKWYLDDKMVGQVKVDMPEELPVYINGGNGLIIDWIKVTPGKEADSLTSDAKTNLISQPPPSTGQGLAIEMSRFEEEEDKLLKSDLYSSTRQKVCLNGDWDFFPVQGEEVTKHVDRLPENITWSKLRVPGSWDPWRLGKESALPLLSLASDYHVAWYRKSLKVPAGWKDKSVELQFGKVAWYARVFANSRYVGDHLGGATSFVLDATPFLRYGEDNTITVYVVDEKASRVVETGGWDATRYGKYVSLPILAGGNQGITGEVYLEAKSPVHVEDTFIISSWRNKNLTVQFFLRNQTAEDQKVTIESIITDLSGNMVMAIGSQTLTLPPGETQSMELRKEWRDARPWCPDDPYLYYLKTIIKSENNIIDESYTRFGFREVWVEGNNLVLNGKIFRLRGDWFTFLPASLAHQRPEYLKTFFAEFKSLNYLCPRVDGISSSPLVFDVADEMGFPLISTGYELRARELLPEGMENALKEIDEWIQRDRNHPSIFIWSVENEGTQGMQTDKSTRFQQMHWLDQEVFKQDPTRPFMHDGASGMTSAKTVKEWLAIGDFFGTTPVENWHYPFKDWSFAHRLNIPKDWSENKNEYTPLIMGEVFGLTTGFGEFGHMCEFIGDHVFDGVEEVYRAKAEIHNLVIGAYRSYGISGLMLFDSARNALGPAQFGNAGWYQSIPFKWSQDINGRPFPHPIQYCNGRDGLEPNLNPWLSTSPRVTPTPYYYDFLRSAFAPLLVTLAREIRHNYTSGEKISREVFVVNDSFEEKKNLSLEVRLEDANDRLLWSDVKNSVNLGQGEIKSFKFLVPLPAATDRTEVNFKAILKEKANLASQDKMKFHLFPSLTAPKIGSANIALYDTVGLTARIFGNLNVRYQTVDWNHPDLREADILVIGYHSLDDKVKNNLEAVKKFLLSGKNVLVFEQETGNGRAYSFAFVKAPNHPVFKGLSPDRLYFWSGLDGDILRSFYPQPLEGNFKVLVEVGNTGNEIGMVYDYGVALMEFSVGQGKSLLCNLEVSQRYGEDPEATQLYHNLLNVASSNSTEPFSAIAYVGESDTRVKKWLEDIQCRYIDITGTISGENLSKYKILLVGNNSIVKDSEIVKFKSKIIDFVNQGGQVFCFSQEAGTFVSDWLPVPLEIKTASDITVIRKVSDDPMLDGIGAITGSVNKGKITWEWQRNPLANPIPGVNSEIILPAGSAWVSYLQPLGEWKTAPGTWSMFYPAHPDASMLAGLNFGKGKYLLCQIPLESASENITRFWGTILSNFGLPAMTDHAITYLLRDVKAKKTDQIVGTGGFTLKVLPRKAADEDLKNYFLVDLGPYCNQRFKDDVAGDQKGGWDDTGENDLRNVPVGKWVMAGIPFEIIDVSKELMANEMKSCIVLAEESQRPYFPKEVKGIEVNEKLSKLYFLHAATFSNTGYEIGKYIIHYSDGSQREISLKTGKNIGEWWEVDRGDLPEARVAWMGENPVRKPVGLFMMEWTNPDPKKTIEAIDFVSNGLGGVPILVAVTGFKYDFLGELK